MDRQPWSVFTDYNRLPWRQGGFIDEEIRTLNQIKQSGPQTDPQTVPSYALTQMCSDPNERFLLNADREGSVHASLPWLE